MANFNSDLITNIVASPPVKNVIGASGGRRRTKIAQYSFTGAQSNGDTVRMFRVRSSDVIHSLLSSNGGLTGMTDVNFGLYNTGNSGTVVDDNLFDDAQTFATLAIRTEKRVGTDSAFPSPTNLGQMVWELLGLSADPATEYDVTLTVITAGSASGPVTLEMEYTAGD